jgi:hypothetical protein
VWLTVQRYVETVSLSSTMGKAFKIRRLTLNLKKDKSIDVDWTWQLFVHCGSVRIAEDISKIIHLAVPAFFCCRHSQRTQGGAVAACLVSCAALASFVSVTA